MIFFTSKEDALAAGLTHHGRMFGVPAWVFVQGEAIMAAPKFWPFTLWCWIAHHAFELATNFISEDSYFEPITVGKPIEGTR